MTKIMRTQVKMGVMRMKLIMKMKKKADDDLLNIEIQQIAKELSTDWQTSDWVAVVKVCASDSHGRYEVSKFNKNSDFCDFGP